MKVKINGSLRERNGLYYYRISTGKVDGKYKYIERYAGKTEEEARKTLLKVSNEYDTTGRIFKESGITFSDLLDDWFKNKCVGSVREGTKNDYNNVIKNHLKKEPFANKRINTLTIDELQEYINRKSSILAKSTMKAHFVVLNKALEYAVYPKQYIKESPMHYVTRPKKQDDVLEILDDDEKKIETITTEEYNEVLKCISHNPQLQLVFQIAWFTGARLGEVCALTWDDVDFTEKTLVIKKNLFYNSQDHRWELGKTKNGKPRTIEISDTLVGILKRAKHDQKLNRFANPDKYINKYLNVVKTENTTHIVVSSDTGQQLVDFVCVQNNGQIISNQYVKTSITRYIRKGGQGIDFHFHMIRHTHATLLLSNGASMKEVQDRLGHSKITTTMDVYAHTTKQTRKKTADLFDMVAGQLL